MSFRFMILLLPAVILSSVGAADPIVAIVVPSGLTTCGVFQDGRSLALEHDLKCRLRLREGRFEVPVAVSTVPADLVEAMEFGPDGIPGTPLSPGAFKITREPSQNCAPGASCYRLAFVQDFSAGGTLVHLEDYT